MSAADASPSVETIAGIDVGGTFTDLILIGGADGGVRIAKTPTTPQNQADGVLAALEAAGVAPAALDLIVHGTTTTTNAVLERRLARTGLITTAGFRDVLELGRRTRPQPYGMTGRFRPVIPRDLRLEVPERMDATGEILVPLDEGAVRDAVRALLDRGCESLVIHFLHAYANPAHELRAAEVAAELWPNGHVTMGHALLSESREFERGATAAVNASVQPILERYLARLQAELAAQGYGREILVMNGNGGMVSARLAGREAAKTVMSGPASGVMAAAYTGRRAGCTNLITYDMGGTSSDVSLIRGAEPAVSHEIEIEYAMPIHVPMVDVRTIGAGGGSIVSVDEGGLLRVGPESAGAMPGPICFGRGGTEPTISDANLLLGRLNPAKLLSVDGMPPVESVRAAFAGIGAALGLDAEGAAEAAIRVANANMAGAIRMVSISMGHDPRDFALFAFGGAGPLHAAALARELAIPRVLVPARPGITNALGCAVADLRHDFVRTVNRPLDSIDIAHVHAILAEQTATGRETVARNGASVGRVRAVYTADMQFVGQTHLIRVALPDAAPARETLQQLFEAAYYARFKVELPTIRANLVNLNTSVIGERAAIDLGALADGGDGKSLDDAITHRRPVRFGAEWHDTPVYARSRLPRDARFAGPAIVEQMDTTVVIPPGDRAETGADGNLFIHVGAA
ncbi:hydantoinase/oxoprolinase family protein [Limibaculum sp. M0105]|uniref:Hydantoinase/oxoprolinase family protein n=1 Tax=Thermohalobaculum xanthum TaxID=2753746 RepID=A0A8J7M817_9RHOB|nr:hydantoinase/oxoprolinase family protein [Thermohalobaculum xanthum]MBK0399607.1 hydantoinase/oxoprolinase family protein [Thermohalobaculum xanthum]